MKFPISGRRLPAWGRLEAKIGVALLVVECQQWIASKAVVQEMIAELLAS